jgi:long-chain acyl-CoA synthetase
VSVLLTGATGFLGMEVLARLLEQGEREVVAVVRARDDAHARERLDEVLRTLGVPGSDAVRAVAGDLRAEALGVRAPDVTEIIHCAASISFTLPLDEAREVNVVGTRQVLALARRLPALRRVVHVSTAYVAGAHRGVFGEDDLDVGQAFRNSYERSKHETERMLRGEATDLPLVVARPSIVVGESGSGWTPAFNVLYWPLRAYERGLLDRLPALPGGRLDVVPVDYVAAGLLDALDGDERGTVHLVAGEEAPTNAEVSRMAARALGRPEPAFDEAADLALAEAGVYLPYFDVETTFTRERAGAPPSLASYFDALIAYARRARWGKRPLSRAAASDDSQVPLRGR